MRLLSDYDRYTVAVVVSEWLYTSTLAVVADAACSDASLLQSLNNNVSTTSGQTIVDAIVTCTSVSVTSYVNLSLRISLQVLNNVVNLLLLALADNSATNLEEDIAAEWLSSCSSCLSRCWSRNLNNLLYDLLYVADLWLWSRDETCRVGLTEVVLNTSKCIEVPIPVLCAL